MKDAQMNARCVLSISGATIELGEDATGNHVLEIGGLPVATSENHGRILGLYMFLCQAATPVVSAIVDQVTATEGAPCGTCHRAEHTGPEQLSYHTYTVPSSTPMAV